MTFKKPKAEGWVSQLRKDKWMEHRERCCVNGCHLNIVSTMDLSTKMVKTNSSRIHISL